MPSKLLRRKAGKCHLPCLQSCCISGHETWAQPFGNFSLERLEAGGKWEKWVWGQIFPSCFALGLGEGGWALSCRVFNCLSALLSPFFSFGDVFAPTAPVLCECFISLPTGEVQGCLAQMGSGKKSPRTPRWWVRGGHSPPPGFPVDRVFLLSFGRGETPAQMSPDLSQGFPSTRAGTSNDASGYRNKRRIPSIIPQLKPVYSSAHTWSFSGSARAKSRISPESQEPTLVHAQTQKCWVFPLHTPNRT